MPRPRTAVTGGIPQKYASSPVKAAAFERVRNASIAYEQEQFRINQELQKQREKLEASARLDLAKAMQRAIADGLPIQGVAEAYGVTYTTPVKELLAEYGALPSESNYEAIEPGTNGWVEYHRNFQVVMARGSLQVPVQFKATQRRLISEPGFGGVIESAWVYAGVTAEGVFFCVGEDTEGSPGVWFPTTAQYTRFRDELGYPEGQYPYVFSATESYLVEETLT